MKTLILLLLAASVPASAQVASRPLANCDSKVRVEQRVINTTVATQFFSTGTVNLHSASSGTYLSSRKWVEVYNLNPSTASWVYISTFATTNVAYGIPLANSGAGFNSAFGGPSSIRLPWGPNIPVWVWRKNVAGLTGGTDATAVACE